jgi:divalent metal cation (Fe/Co/Zn/Cd) transporter
VICDIRRLAEADPAVRQVRNPLTMHLGPENVLLNLGIVFRPDLSGDALSGAIDHLEKTIQPRHPEVKRVFIEAESFRDRSDAANRPG